MYKYIIVFLLSFSVFGQNTEPAPQVIDAPSKIQVESILKKIESLKSRPYEEVISSLGELEQLEMNYVEQENLQCISEVTIVEKDSEGNKQVTKRKLNHKERKICLKKVVEFRMKYVDKFYELRKELLLKLHKTQLQDLKDQNELNKSELEKILTKYN